MRHILGSSAFLAAAIAAVVPVAAQVATVDAGSFTITRGGDRVGREEFAIRRSASPGGDVIVANATVAYSDRQLQPALRADNVGAPLAYEIKVSSGTEVQERLRGVIGRGRFSAQVRTPRGESAKEYTVADGALILDDDVFHQYYFLAQNERTGSIPVVIPRRNVQILMRVENKGADAVTIGGKRVPAIRYVLTEPNGGEREVWVDARGRVLRVAIPDRGITALRDEPPQ